jgi:DNA-binding IclR family transcriptional regulator
LSAPVDRKKTSADSDNTVRSVQRAATILKLVAAEAGRGLRLSDIARETGLGKATTHRLLTALTTAGLVYQASETRRYLIGYEIIRMGHMATRYDIAELARPAMLRLARETGDTVFISVREGLDALCLAREVGDFPIKTLTLSAGDRRPLGVGAGSLALLAFLPEEEIKEIIAANAARLATYENFTADDVRRLTSQTRSDGHSFNDGRIVHAMCAVGVPVFDARGKIAAALSIAAIRERMAAERVAWIVSLLGAEARKLTALLEGAAIPPALEAGHSSSRSNA